MNYESMSRADIDRTVRDSNITPKERGKALRALERRDKGLGYCRPTLCVEYPITCYHTGGSVE